MPHDVAILEFAAGSKPVRVDAEKGILYGVKFLGERSANPPPNNNVYPRTMREAAAAVLEGARLNINHPERGKENHTRPYEDGAGVARNLKEGGDGLYGDAHFNPAHSLWPQICWDAEHCPTALGFSIHAHGKASRSANGEQIVEAISADPKPSIDLVSRPATTRGLFESRQPMPEKKTIKAILAEALKDKPDRLKLLEAEQLPAMSAEMTPPEGGDSASQADAAFEQMVCGVFRDKSLDMKAKLAKIKEILKAQEKLMGNGAPETPAEEPPAEESLKPGNNNQTALREELDALKRQLEARELCDAEGVTPNRVLSKALAAAKDRSEMQALIKEHKETSPAPTGTKPRSGLPIREDRRDDKTLKIEDQKQFVESCFG